MTRFCWWTLIWFGLALADRIVDLHYAGWELYHTYYSSGMIALAGLINLTLWIGLWHLIIKNEAGRTP